MPSIRKSFLQFVLSGSYMKRWNDKLRPTEFYEVDKQAHKMIVAFALAEIHAKDFPLSERQKLHRDIVEWGIFDYLFRMVVTDIKPPIFYRISSKEDEFKVLVDWAVAETECYIRPLGEEVWDRYQARVGERKRDTLADRILSAAHIFASRWEYQLIRPLNVYDDEAELVGVDLDRQLDAYSDIPEVKLLKDSSSTLHKFANLCGQLRFQKRWSQVPRIPETSVLGHMFIVASYAYFFSLVEGACQARCVNNFYAGLFHDLPELLTRDIISPVKKSSDLLANLIQNYENSELEERVFQPLEKADLHCLAGRLKYYLGLEVGSEFKESIVDCDKIRPVDFQELNCTYNDDRFDPKDGVLLKICDTLAAFIEAYTAVRNGIGSDQLHEALWRMRSENMKNSKIILRNIHLASLYADFD